MKKRVWILAVILAVLAGVAVFLALPRNDYILPALRYRLPKIDQYPLFGRAVVAAGDPQPWPYAPGVASARIPDSVAADFARYGTTAYLVVKDGQIVLEQYWDGYADTLWSNSFSMAKSVVSLLVGCAIDDGYVQSVEQPVSDFVPGDWTWRPKVKGVGASVGAVSAAVAAGSAGGAADGTVSAGGSSAGLAVRPSGRDEVCGAVSAADAASARGDAVSAAEAVGSPKISVGSEAAGAFETAGSPVMSATAVPLRIRDLLTMSAGFRWNESSASLFSPTTQIYYGGDLAAILHRTRFKERPGVNFEYQSGVTQLLAMVLTAAVGRPLADYASEKLWRPLGAEEDALWSIDGKGVEKAFCCFNSNARDFARLGQLILQDGRWNGVPLVDSAYVRAAVTPADYLRFGDAPCTFYGYQMWIARHRGHTMPYCRGILGQYIITIPDENMVVVRLGRARSEERNPVQDYTLDLELWVNTALDMFAR